MASSFSGIVKTILYQEKVITPETANAANNSISFISHSFRCLLLCFTISRVWVHRSIAWQTERMMVYIPTNKITATTACPIFMVSPFVRAT
jgi:hypothetical protein